MARASCSRLGAQRVFVVFSTCKLPCTFIGLPSQQVTIIYQYFEMIYKDSGVSSADRVYVYDAVPEQLGTGLFAALDVKGRGQWREEHHSATYRFALGGQTKYLPC